MTALRLAALLAAFALVPTAEAQVVRQGQPQQLRQGGRVPAPRQQDKIFPLNSSWIAVSLSGRRFSGERPSFSLDDQFRARGFSGCNTYSATAYPLREQMLGVGPFAVTKKACSKDLMAIEHAFLVALRTSGKWDLQGPILTIATQNGELRFERAL